MMPANRVDTLIFDYDGVIANTEPLHWRSWAEILVPLGIKFTWDQYCEFGRGVHDARMLKHTAEACTGPFDTFRTRGTERASRGNYPRSVQK